MASQWAQNKARSLLVGDMALCACVHEPQFTMQSLCDRCERLVRIISKQLDAVWRESAQEMRDNCADLMRSRHRRPSTNATTQSYITVFNGACESLERAIRAIPLED